MNPRFTLPQLTTWLAQARAKGQRIVLTNGCFDLLHVGHVRYLQAARQLGDVLIVGVNSDASVSSLKGPSRPINQAEDRAEVLAALACVDQTIIFTEHSADNLIEAIHPDLYVKAGDYSLDTLPERETLIRLDIQTAFVPFEKGYSTTQTLARSQAQ